MSHTGPEKERLNAEGVENLGYGKKLGSRPVAEGKGAEYRIPQLHIVILSPRRWATEIISGGGNRVNIGFARRKDYTVQTMADRVHYSRGRVMFPLIPHRTLVGIEDLPFDWVRCGEIIACGGNGLPPLLRVIERGSRPSRLTCIAEYRGDRFQVGENEYRGVARWRSYRGCKQGLGVDEGDFLGKIYLAAARAEACSRFAAPLRKWMSRRIVKSTETNCSSKEITYLLRCLRPAIHGREGGPPVPPEEMDWDVCLDLSLGHAVHSLLGPLWNSLPSQHAPPDYLRQLIADEEEKTARAWNDARQILGVVLPALAEAGIPCLLLKGPSLVEAYGDRFEMRGFSDLDLLVQPRGLGKALECLERLGFVPKVGGKAQSLILKGHFHLVMKPPPPWTLPVELHWELVDRGNFYRIDLEGVFGRARALELSGEEVPVLGVEDELVYLCLHLCKHGVMNRFALYENSEAEWLARPVSGNRLIWFIDLLFCIEKEGYGPVPSLLWERACSWNADDKVLECLQLLNRLFSSPAVEKYVKAFPHSRLPGQDRRKAMKSFWLGGKRRQRLLGWGMSPHPLFSVRPVRLLELWGLFFPSRNKLRRYYGNVSLGNMIWRRLTHPFHMARRLLR
jgi:hypothetical protein